MFNFKCNTQGIIDNLQNIAGVIVGLTVCKAFGVTFGKEHRGMHKMFSHTAANSAAKEGVIVWLPYKVIVR